MNPEKAIQDLKSYANASCFDFSETFKAAITALEKQVPKKPVPTHFAPKCPRCDVSFIFGFLESKCRYCPECGQSIDWSAGNHT